ncbi:MAG TPA: sigma-70 family RNA polymerase sigma factor [Actinomycetes bacterium]|nr:sigma-70 family RNA polymerase sigma factor [Actinomycetes bacterium]
MEPTDQELLAATAAGDGEAFAMFWRRHMSTVMAFGIHRCASSEDVADLVADTFLAAFRAAGRYRAETATAIPWLLGIAARVASNQQRRLARWLRVGRRVAGEPPRFTGEEYEAVEAAIDAARQAPHVQAVLRAMSVEDRKVLELVAYDQLSPTEAAVALGISANAARLRLTRARKRLREQLASTDTPAGLAAPDTEVSSHDH